MTHSPLAAPLSFPTPAPGLLVLVAAGDREALSMLYDAYSSRLFGLVLRVVGDRAQAEEVTQEVFLEIWRTADLYDPDREGVLGWMLSMAHRAAVARVRSSKGLSARVTWDAEPVAGFRVDGTPAGAGPTRQAARVLSSLDVLTPVQRRALELAYFGGHTHAEVAQILQIPMGSAKSRIRNALIHLRESLGPAHA